MERQSFVLRHPERLGVAIDGAVRWITADSVDFRFEDWGYEPGAAAPPNGNFSAACTYLRTEPEAGTGMRVVEAAAPLVPVPGYINFAVKILSGQGALEPEAAYPVIRPDWARFAEFNLGNRTVKPGEHHAERRQLTTV